MRIAFVTDTYVPQVNGVTTVLRRMCRPSATRDTTWRWSHRSIPVSSRVRTVPS